MSAMSRNAMLDGSNPKLQQVKYVNLLPEGKQGDYTQQNRIDFMPDPVTTPYFDGAQSYLNLEIRNTSTFSAGNGNAPTASPPLCFPAHMGANAVINRMLLRAKENGQVIEDIEAYNMINGIKNAYTNDSDVFKTLGRITGVAGRTCNPANQTIDNLAINYFLPNGAVVTDAITGGNVASSASFCIPIESGLCSAFAGQHHVVPNLDVPLHFQFFLEKNNVALQVMSSKFYRQVTINGSLVQEEYAKSPLENHAVVKAGAIITFATTECETDLAVDNDLWTLDKCAFRVGQSITDGTDTRVIQAITQDTGAGSDQIAITLDAPFTIGDGAINVRMSPINRSYVIDKCELKLLLTIPDQPTMRMIRSQMARGISFASVQLYKQSTSAQLKNAVVDIPEALTKVMSLLAIPVQQDDLEALDIANSYVYCRPDSLLPAGGNTNNTTYQWQIQNTLIPNLSVETNGATNNKNDNAIFFNQVVMALRHLVDVKALSDDPLVRKSQDVDIELPFFYPVSLSPKGQSFDLVNSAPQLRINNSANGADVTAKLFHVFAIHTRILKSTEMGASIEF